MMHQHVARTVLLSLFAFALVGPTQAETILTFSGDMSDAQVLGLTANGGGSYEGGYSGRYKAQVGGAPGQGATDNIFCVDANHNVFFGQSYAVNDRELLTAPATGLNGASYGGGLASALQGDYGVTISPAEAARRASEVAYLADTYLGSPSAFASGLSGSTNRVDNYTGISLSIWDLVQDGGDGVTSGAFQLQNAGNTPGLVDLANYFESQAALHPNYSSRTAYWVQASRDGHGGHGQDFVMLGSPAPTPEPAPALALLLGAAGVCGLASRRARASGAS